MKKIVVIGPESTGKSTLCHLLAQHFDCDWCPEFAREYLLQNGINYNATDLITIAKGQLALEKKYSKSEKPFLFIDTDMYVMKVWSEYVFGQCDQFILNAINEQEYDLYLLCNTDLPWVADELREYPDEETRKVLYQIYRDILINQSVPWVEISGNYEERVSKAIEAVTEFTKQSIN